MDDGQYLSHSDAEPKSGLMKKGQVSTVNNTRSLTIPVNYLNTNGSSKSPALTGGKRGHLGQAAPVQTSDAMETNDHIQEMKQGESKILVAVRLRPMWKKELDKGEISIVKILDRNVVILMDPADVLNEEKVLGKNRTKEKQYAFDFAFDEHAP